MAMLTQFKFNIYPQHQPAKGFIKPRGYLFRGVFMQWMKEYNQQIGNQLHRKQGKGEILVGQKYSLHQHRLPLPKSAQSHQAWRAFPNVKGVQFVINSIDKRITKTLVDFLMRRQDQVIQLGPQPGVITSVALEQHRLQKFLESPPTLKEVGVRFITPTAYSIMGSKAEMRFPLPEYVFGNLSRLWNMIFKDTPKMIPANFYTWVQEKIAVSSYKLETKAWDRGKQYPFVGFMGWVRYRLQESEHDLAKWVPILIKLGQYMNTGIGRTAGFGRIIVENTKK